MSEVTTIRAQIKAWERSFKDTNGRPPTVDDIKQNPNIAEQYKRYKKLCKVAATAKSTQESKSTVSPSTPPKKTRPKDPTALLLSKSRAIQPSTPLASFNPFSPQKRNNGKEKVFASTDKVEEFSNPFFQADSTRRVRKAAPDDLLPTIPPSQTPPVSSSSYDLNPPAFSTSAVSRARKRLRGEPVSPSPNKDKRRRVASQTNFPFPSLKLDVPDSDNDGSVSGEADSSFVDNSPVKAPIPGKSFHQLFQNSILPTNLFGSNTLDEVVRDKPSASATGARLLSLRRTSHSKQDLGYSAVNNSKDTDLRIPPLRSSEQKNGLQSEAPVTRSSVKRSFMEEDSELDTFASREKSPMIPPSPPPLPKDDISLNKPGKMKVVANKGIASWKKVKIDDQARGENESDDPEQQESMSKLRIVGRNAVRRQHALTRQDEDSLASDSDPSLGFTRFMAPRASTQDNAQLQDGNIEIDLPDELRRVLALQSAESRTQVSEEARLVKGLLYGRRTHHYDPQKGGEIWDVGEDHHVTEGEGHAEGEDDWEEEPVPWEVGEL